MRDHCQEDDDPDLRAGLEADADRESVQEAVKREAERAGEADVVMMSRRVVLLLAVNDRQFFEQKNREKSDHHGDHQRAYRNALVKGRCRDFRNEIEKCDADDQARRERHDVEQIALVSERERAAGQRHHEGGQRVDSRHFSVV